MKESKALNKKSLSMPAIGLMIILILFFFGVAFNYFQSVKVSKSMRGLASDGQKQNLHNELESIALKSVIEKSNSKGPIRYGKKPTLKDQFLFGRLKGKYKVTYIQNKLVSLKIKSGQEFEKIKNFEAFKKDFENSFLSGNKEALIEDKDSRVVASTSKWFNLLSVGLLIGKVEFIFAESDENNKFIHLKEIQIIRN